MRTTVAMEAKLQRPLSLDPKVSFKTNEDVVLKLGGGTQWWVSQSGVATAKFKFMCAIGFCASSGPTDFKGWILVLGRVFGSKSKQVCQLWKKVCKLGLCTEVIVVLTSRNIMHNLFCVIGWCCKYPSKFILDSSRLWTALVKVSVFKVLGDSYPQVNTRCAQPVVHIQIAHGHSCHLWLDCSLFHKFFWMKRLRWIVLR